MNHAWIVIFPAIALSVALGLIVLGQPSDNMQGMNMANAGIGKHFTVIAESVDLPTSDGRMYHAMTFNGTVPGPTIRVTQGDTVTITLVNKDMIPHGFDTHAAQMSAVPDMGAVKPGETHSYTFVAEVAGTFSYHCSGVNVALMDQHDFGGMDGLMIVDPKDGYKDGAVKEMQYIYTDNYLTKDGNYDQEAMFEGKATEKLVNGMAFGYTPNADDNLLIKGFRDKNIFVAQPWNNPPSPQWKGQPIFVDVGKTYRMFVQNLGNSEVSFHIVGEILDTVDSEHVISGPTETTQIGSWEGKIITVKFDHPGVYVIVDHNYATGIFKGRASVIIAGDYFNLADKLKNLGLDVNNMPVPSDVVPPYGTQSIPQKQVTHCMCTDEHANEVSKVIGGLS